MNQKINWIRQILVVLVIIAAVGGLYSCEKVSYLPRPVDPNNTWLFQTDIQPIFTANCITCHGGAQSPDLRDGKSYAALSKGGYLKTPAESNRLYVQITSTGHSAKSTASDKLKVLYWITQGALNN
jgi:hypothetical protein